MVSKYFIKKRQRAPFVRTAYDVANRVILALTHPSYMGGGKIKHIICLNHFALQRYNKFLEYANFWVRKCKKNAFFWRRIQSAWNRRMEI